jgi:tetratricopeptide (TPR) repeat protein
MSGKKNAAAPSRRLGQALEVYERAMKALGKRDFERARDHFSDVIASYAEERDVVERAKSYLGLCQRSLEKKPSFKPKSFEEQLNYGVFLHNRGQFEEALKYLGQAAEQHPKNEHVLYCLAATAARAGDTPAAVKALRASIAVNPANRAQARSDSDFDPIREDDDFVDLVHPED